MGKLLLVILSLFFPFHASASDETRYVQQLIELTEKGDSEAQFALALIHEYGNQGITRDPEKSATLLLQAGKAGIPGACLYLGLKYENGNGVKRSQTEAARWYSCAAEKNWAMAQFHLARLYEKGEGVEENKDMAITWYGLAAEQGYPGAQEAVGRLNRHIKK
jgi:TPR repeat protein